MPYFDISKSELEQLYTVEIKSTYEIAKILGCNDRTIRRRLDKFNIPRRIIGKGYKRKINKDFFKESTPEMEWVLGFIYADGNLYSFKNSKMVSYILTITQKEPNVLHKIKQLLQSEHTINQYGGKYHRLMIGNKTIYNDLMELGLHPHKSATMLYPNTIKFHSHFIRGFFDGDGSIRCRKNYNKTKKRYAQIRFFSNSLQFLQELNEHLPVKGTFFSNKNNGHTLNIGKHDHVFKLYKWLYKDSYDAIRLERKYKIFKERYRR
jgi:intein-encoded DNA endonuclease-like protein